MTSFVTSFNPFVSGTKPRTFLAARAAMLKREQLLKKVDKESYPKHGEDRPKR